MKTLEQIEAEFAAKRAKAIHEHNAAQLLPTVPRFVCAHSDYVSAAYDAPTLRAALEIAHKFGDARLIAYEFAGVFGHFMPECLIQQSRSAKADFENPKRNPLACVAHLRLDQFRLSRDDVMQARATLHFFAQFDAEVFSVDINICDYRAPYHLRMRPVFGGKSDSGFVDRWDYPPNIRIGSARESRYSGGSRDSNDTRFHYVDWQSIDCLCDAIEPIKGA